ncbi:MAG: ABC transporter substrate-binding protein [Dethiobacter sp.]|nr:ABC transporter substrate-binding protein [Dethiobacter sp.]
MMDEKTGFGPKVQFEYDIAQTPDVLTARILSQEVDLAALPINLAAKLYNKGVDYQLVAVNTWGNMYLLNLGSDINSWADLKGKTIHSIGMGATPDIVFRSLLNANGLEADKDVFLNYSLEQVELANAMAAEKIELAVLPEPFVTMVISKNSGIVIVMDLQEEWYKAKGSEIPIAQGGMVVKKEFAQKHPEVVKEFLQQYAASIEWVNHNLLEASILVEKYGLGMSAKIAEKAIPRSNIRFSSAGDARKAVESYLQVLLDFAPESVGGKLPDAGFYY